MSKIILILVYLILQLAGHTCPAQRRMSSEEVLQLALEQNALLKVAKLETELARQQKKLAFEPGKTGIILMRGQYNSIARDDQNLSITQSFSSPTTYYRLAGWYKQNLSVMNNEELLSKLELLKSIKLNLEQQQYQITRLKLLQNLAALYDTILQASKARYRTGEAPLLEQQQAELQAIDLQQQMMRLEEEQRVTAIQLGALLSLDEGVKPAEEFWKLKNLNVDTSKGSDWGNPHLLRSALQKDLSKKMVQLEKSRFMPEVSLGYFNQTLIGTQLANGEAAGRNQRFQGWQAGVMVPVWFRPQAIRLQSAKLKLQQSELIQLQRQRQWLADWETAKSELVKWQKQLNYYENNALIQSKLIKEKASLAFRNGEIDFLTVSLASRQAIQTEEQYLLAKLQYHQSLILIEFLSGYL